MPRLFAVDSRRPERSLISVPMVQKPGIVEMSDYVRECLREDDEFILFRARASSAEIPSVLLLTPASQRPRLESLKKIDHEYSLCRDFDTTWAVRALALSRYNGQKALVLEDPGGDCKAEVSLVYPFRSS
jgi:hypothetical protein